MIKKPLALLIAIVLLCSSIAAIADAGWICPKCGKELPATAKFCPNDRSEKPADSSLWDCSSCGQTGSVGNFCSNCGAAKPKSESDETWDCSICGQTDSIGNFCSNCGAAKPDPKPDETWDCANCGQSDNSGNFCPHCGAPKGGSAGAAQDAHALSTRKTNADGSYVDYFFNSANQLTFETTHAFSGAVIQTVEHSYNAINQQTASETWQYAENGSFKLHYVSAYDYAGNEAKRTYYFENGKTRSRLDYQYNASGYMTRKEYHSWKQDGSFSSHQVSEYDSADNMTKYTYYYENGKIFYYNDYQYNASGTKTRWEHYSWKQDGSFSSHIVREYNGAGIQTKCTYYDANGNIIK